MNLNELQIIKNLKFIIENTILNDEENDSNLFNINNNIISDSNGLLLTRIIPVFQCIYCNEVFVQFFNIYKHYKTIHLNDNCVKINNNSKNEVLDQIIDKQLINNLLNEKLINCLNEETNGLIQSEINLKTNCDSNDCDNNFSNKSKFKNRRLVHQKVLLKSNSRHFNSEQKLEKSIDLEKPFKCEHLGCDKSYAQKSTLTSHIACCHELEKSKSCHWPGCEKRFIDNKKLQIHYRTHTGEKVKTCDWPGCEKLFNNPSVMRSHRKTHTGERPFGCDWPGCESSFAEKSSLKRHKNLVHIMVKVQKSKTHKRKEDRIFKCEFDGCQKSYASKQDLSKHSNIHTSPRVCDECGKLFANWTQLKAHIRIHSDEKPFKCEWNDCKFEAKQLAGILAHKITHTGEKPFKCDRNDCKKVYSSYNGLNRHIARIHDNSFNIKCFWPGCEKRFVDKNEVKKHYRRHTGEKTYECDWPECGRKFGEKATMKNHKRTHTGERPYVCDWPGCESSFALGGTLQTHKKLVHKCDYIKRSRWDRKKLTSNV